MTVKSLIELLKVAPPDTEVMYRRGDDAWPVSVEIQGDGYDSVIYIGLDYNQLNRHRNYCKPDDVIRRS